MRGFTAGNWDFFEFEARIVILIAELMHLLC